MTSMNRNNYKINNLIIFLILIKSKNDDKSKINFDLQIFILYIFIVINYLFINIVMEGLLFISFPVYY